jgi:hypothetical protein
MSDLSYMPPYVAGAVVAAVVYLVLRASGSRKGLPLPPGPRRLPIIGNLVRDNYAVPYRMLSCPHFDASRV